MGKPNTVKKIAAGAILIGAAGYLAGILTAPKSGKETRRDIRSAASKAMREAEKRLKTLYADLNELVISAKEYRDNVSGRARNELDGLTDKAIVAKEQVRFVLSAIHEGDADDPDLKLAVEEAESASKHLRKFLSKKMN